MGKSPGKWLKTLIGKKPNRSHTSKGRDSTKITLDRDYSGRKDPAAADGNSPVISDPVLVNTERSGIIQDNKGTSSEPAGNVDFNLSARGLGEANGSENSKEVQAATKAQAALRGYLARRAFRALKGIIRLQAVVRGYLVRRQAVSTLRAMHGLVQFQSLIRGWEVRRSSLVLEVSYHKRKAPDLKNGVTWREKVSTNAYIRKLVFSTPAATPLRVKYDDLGLPNSLMSWMERWSSSCFWKPVPQPKKTIETKTQKRRSNYTTRTESGRSKRVVRKNTTNTKSGSTNVISEPEKSRRVVRKFSNSPVDALQEPHFELVKVKRNLKRVSNLATDQASHRRDDTEKPNRVTRKSTSSLHEVTEQTLEANIEKPRNEDHAEISKEDVSSQPETNPDVESSPKEMSPGIPAEVLGDENSTTEATPVPNSCLPNSGKQENILMNGDMDSKEEQTCYENQKKQRSSFLAKSEYTEDGLQSTPALPSYMSATESAKAKLRDLNSPILGSDTAERNGFTRRYSLPSSTNVKLSSHSPRTQRLFQASAKGSRRGDRSLLSSRDGHDKPIQVEWRR